MALRSGPIWNTTPAANSEKEERAAFLPVVKANIGKDAVGIKKLLGESTGASTNRSTVST